MKLQIVNQPNEESTIEALQASLGKTLTERERSKVTVNVDLDGARKYFENLANSFL